MFKTCRLWGYFHSFVFLFLFITNCTIPQLDLYNSEASARFGWWDDEKKEPIITDLKPLDLESIEEAKAEKKRQLEDLKRILKAKKEREEAEKKEAEMRAEKEKNEEKTETEESKDDNGNVESSTCTDLKCDAEGKQS